MRKRIIPFMAVVMALAMSVTAFAAEQPQTVIGSENGGTTITITDITPREEETDEQEESKATEFRIGSYYPVEIRTAEDNGYQLLIKTFIVPQGTSPEALIEEALTRRGVEYQVSDILKRELDGSKETRTVSETVSMPTESDKKSELLALFDSEMTYSEDGFTGILKLNEQSITSEATDTEGYSYTLKDVKEYTGLERNDPYYIPKTAEKYGVTLQLADVDWTPMASRSDNSRTPSLFKATATYTGTAWGSKETDFLATATYSGEVTKVTEGDVVYSIVYEEVPEVAERSFASLFSGSAMNTLFCLAAAAFAVGMGYLAVKWALRKRSESAEQRDTELMRNDPYANRPAMDLPDMLDEMDRGLEDDV